MAAELQAHLGLNSLEGRLVEIHGLSNKRLEGYGQGHLAPASPVDLDGQKGQCLGFDEGTKEYLVVTFDGITASVPPENLSEYLAPLPEDGGFDVAWPEGELGDEAEVAFGCVMAEALQVKGYCMVQTSIHSAVRKEAFTAALDLADFQDWRQETVVDYMGRDNSTKLRKLQDDDPDRTPDNGLAFCDRYLTNVGLMLGSVDLDSLGFEIMGRTNAFARTPFDDDAEKKALEPEPVSSEDVASGRVQEFIRFLQGRKLCMILVLEGSGGEVTLTPRPGQGDTVRLPLSVNRLLLFRHDRMSYSFQPGGRSLALQAWLLSGLPDVEMTSRFAGPQKDFAEMMSLTGPWQPEGHQALIKSLMLRMPGRSWGYYRYWNMFTAGADCVLEWDGSRWDKELYWEEDRDKAMATGKSYMHHGGFLGYDEFHRFDNDFFDISNNEAGVMYPGQRMIMEVGYEAINRAGYTRQLAKGENIAVHIGDVGPDWHTVDQFWPDMVWHVDSNHTDKRMGVSAGITCSRLSYFLNLTGPSNSVATACSSSLVALNIAHHNMWNIREDPARKQIEGKIYERGLVVGVNTLMAPTSFCGQCQMGATSYKGRCFTFDLGADGYQRGEGCSATFLEMRSDAATDTSRLGCIIGSSVNQDGRSASLTAPNGPSQSSLLKMAMKMGGLQPHEVTAAECHGTGTALGDPIEIGALQNALSKRDRAILKTSAKSNMAHLEASAGMAGFAKCIMMIMSSATPPNLHLKNLNPHLVVEGYPAYFGTEITPWGQNSGYCGVSSFGIGGTNARGEVLGRCQRGPQETRSIFAPAHLEKVVDHVTVPCPKCLGPMNYLDGVAVPKPGNAGKYKPCHIRDDVGDYALCSICYAESGGGFRYGAELAGMRNPGLPIYIRGTWDNYSECTRMEQPDSSTYIFYVALGETRCEQFHLLMDKYTNFAIYPVRNMSGQHVRIQGPDDGGRGNRWLIDGRDDEVSAGTVYQIAFEWRGDERSISWAPVKDSSEMPDQVAGRGYQHRYSLLGSWASFTPQNMSASDTEKGLYEASFQISQYLKEEFYFVRDSDPAQRIYPATQLLPEARGARVVTGSAVPVRGPEQWGKGKNFTVVGKEQEVVAIQLRIRDAHVTVTASSTSLGKRSWMSTEGWGRQTYYITGSFNEGTLVPMERVPESPGIFVHRLVMEADEEQFQILADADPARTMFPQQANASSGEGFLEGPRGLEPGEEARHWLVRGWPGAVFSIVLNMKELDRRRMVTWGLDAAAHQPD